MMKKIAALMALAALLGIGLLAWSCTLGPFADEARFNQGYAALPKDDSAAYRKLREDTLSPKFLLQDYGITLLLAAGFAAWTCRSGRFRLQALRSGWPTIALGLLLPFATVLGFVFDLFQAADRQEFPPWADTLGIPLMGVPFLLFFLLLWAVVHLALLGEACTGRVDVATAWDWRRNWWLLLVSVPALLLALNSLAFGQYWYAVPAAMWVYFYLSLGAGRVAARRAAER